MRRKPKKIWNIFIFFTVLTSCTKRSIYCMYDTWVMLCFVMLLWQNPLLCSSPTLQMKAWWQSNINVWFPFLCSQKWICYFQKRITMFCLPIPTLIYLSEINIFPGSVCLFCYRELCGPILGKYKSPTDTWMCMEIGTEGAQFPEKEYVKGIFLAVYRNTEIQIRSPLFFL